MQRFWLRPLWMVVLGFNLSSASLAQLTPAAPSAAQMVEQLKAPAAPVARPGLRNLKVEATPAAETPMQTPPSLSLQIQFDFNSARVHPDSQTALSNLAQALHSPELQTARFAVEGHTDAKGQADYNQRLSQARANAVCDVLVQHGVVASRLLPSGKGASDLANPQDPHAAENRRVRIVNLN